MTTTDDLLALWADPARTGARATAIRRAAFGQAVWIRSAPTHARPQPAVILRDGDVVSCDRWPAPPLWQAGDRLVLEVAAGATARAAFATWLLAAAEGTAPVSLAPVSSDAAGLHRLWCLAAARIALPATVRIEARHDLLGIRLAQIALGFGADTLSGPIMSDRSLPLAGITRPDEATRAGLANLVRTASFIPTIDPIQAPAPHEEAR